MQSFNPAHAMFAVSLTLTIHLLLRQTARTRMICNHNYSQSNALELEQMAFRWRTALWRSTIAFVPSNPSVGHVRCEQNAALVQRPQYWLQGCRKRLRLAGEVIMPSQPP